MKKRTLLDEYLSKEMIVGGEKTTVGEFIRYWQAQGLPQRCIDMYLVGHERRKSEKWNLKHSQSSSPGPR